MISAILLAAGQSKRMVDENKLTKEFKNIPLIKHSVNNILSSNIDELIIVLGYQKKIVQNILNEMPVPLYTGELQLALIYSVLHTKLRTDP